ncbi:hypothetical protein CR513_10374, partial [Mucuna pruriens]
MKHIFLEKFFSASRTATIKKEVCGIRQHSGETLHEYWERFNKLRATCLHHQISEQLLIQYFYEGLMMMDRSKIDAASGGALMDKTLVAKRHLISNMASNTQQFGIRGASQPRMVNKIGTIDNLRLKNQLTKLTSLVRQLAVRQHQPNIAARVCGIFWKATILAKSESRAICSPAIRIHTEYASTTNRLSITNSTISSTTIPTAATIENVTSRQFTISRGPMKQLATNNLEF